MQALLPAIYPMLKSGFALSFGQIGLLTLIFQVTASLLQPMVGLYTDRRPQPYSLPLGMACSLIGMITLAYAPNFPALLAGAALLGIGSSIFHPESSRLGIRNAMRNAPKASGASPPAAACHCRAHLQPTVQTVLRLIVNVFPVLTERRYKKEGISLEDREAPYVPISQQGPAFRPYRSSFAAIAVSEYRE